MKNYFTIICVVLCMNTAYCQNGLTEKRRKQVDSLETIYLHNCAEKYNYNYRMKEWQACLDEGIKKDSTIAKFWQQKAMPYFKARKYEVGMAYLDKAVKLAPYEWQPYRAFIKCIFAKTYKDAILDFEDCIKKFGNQYVMDHTYNFYIALSYLQLNQFGKAELLLKDYIAHRVKTIGKDWEHPTVMFYYGISLYEQEKYQEAITAFDRALELYKNFPDAKHYKAVCLAKMNKRETIDVLFQEAHNDAKAGYQMNEDNTVYELYPYQIRWNKK